MNLKLFQTNFELKSKVKNYKCRKKEKSNFNYTAIIIVFAEKIHHWIQKLVGKSWKRNRIFAKSQGISSRYFLTTKGRIVTWQWRNHLSQVIKVNIISNKTCQNHEPLEKMHWEGHNITSVISDIILAKISDILLAKNAYAHSKYAKTSDKPQMKDILQNNWLVFMKSVQVMKTRKDC